MFCFEFEGERPSNPPYYQELAQRHRVGAVPVGDRP